MSAEERIFELIKRYWESASIFAANELGLFQVMAQKEMNAEQASEAIGIDVESARIVLDTMVSLEILQRSGPSYRLGPSLQKLFTSGTPISFVISHFQHGWQNWGKIPEILRGKQADREVMTDKDLYNYMLKMDYIAKLVAPRVVNFLNFTQGKLLDVGGGIGRYSILLAQKFKNLKITLIDRSRVAEIAMKIIAQEGLQKHIDVVSGDILDFQFEDKYDAALLANVLHLYPPKKVEVILKRLRSLLKNSGQLIIVDYLLPSNKKPNLDFLLFSLHIMIHTQGGRCYSIGECYKFLKNCGFSFDLVKRIDTSRLGPIDQRFPTLIIATRE